MSYVTRLERYEVLLTQYLKTVPEDERALEQELFASRVIGALSTKMSDDDWNEALVSTVDFAKKMQKLLDGDDK